ncbi:Protein SCO1 like 2, mitochondrial [Apostasia shenzhenica]|uniref:Protein SCO1 like 2, mitochondrial n=1 Tax=Apostasia shenzhenica TaxID=1088818 RepID=A0A2I0AR85_9ASPA|nr:Protein SCO1 like 2, mitochondrial [Apostasia shenzhenica]
MLRLQPMKLSLRQASRVFSSSFRRNRTMSSHTPYRGYSCASNNKNGRLAKHILEEEEQLRSWSWRRYVIPTGLLVIAGAGALIHYNDEKRAIPKGSEGTTGVGRADINKPAIGGPFKLVDSENRLVSESDLRGDWLLLYFGYTSSPDIGPAEVGKMAKAIDLLESQHNLKTKPVYITIDPKRDTPDQLQAYLEEFDSRIIGLTGTIAAVRQIAQEYRVFFKKMDEEGQDYLVECSNNM